MPNHSEELRRRLAAGEPFLDTARWYINNWTLCDDLPSNYEKLSAAEEQVFITRLYEWVWGTSVDQPSSEEEEFDW